MPHNTINFDILGILTFRLGNNSCNNQTTMVAVQTQSLFFLISVDDCNANVMGGFDQKLSHGLFIKRN